MMNARRGPGMQEIRYHVDGVERRAGLFVPMHRDPGRAASLVVYLHGKGERGDALEHLAHGLGKVIASRPERFPGHVLLPQCPRDRLWVEIDQPWATGLPGGQAHIEAALQWAGSHLGVSPRRTVLTGLSMGGFATLIFGARNASRFGALASLCGGGHEADASILAGLPIWMVHGTADASVKVEESRRMRDAILAAKADAPVRLTEYEGVGHNCWDRAYADPALLEFLFRPGFG